MNMEQNFVNSEIHILVVIVLIQNFMALFLTKVGYDLQPTKGSKERN